MINALLVCLVPILINVDVKDPIDLSVLERATYVCKTRYKTCLKSLEKTGPLSYRVICLGS